MARQWQVLLVTAVAVFMSFLDATIVNIAFPDIQRSFPHDSTSALSWILNAYNVVFAATLVLAGRLADLLGRKRFFIGGVLLFLAASTACGLAPSVAFLVGARVVQAIGAAIVVPTSLSLLLPEFPLSKRATATALWGATGAVAAAFGPSLGGVLVDALNWRAVFFVNLVIGLPALVPMRHLLTEWRQERGGPLPDAFGAALLALGVSALSLGIVEGPTWGWGDARVLAALGAGALLLPAFAWRASRARTPIFELELFRVRSFSVANAGTFIFALGFYALLLCNVLFLTHVWGYSIITAGFALTPGPLMAAALAPPSGRLADRIGQRPIALAGGLVFAAGAALFALRVGLAPHYLERLLPATMLTGAGVGMVFSAYGSAAVAELPPSRYATGSAISSCFRQIGAVVGISVLIAIIGNPRPASVLGAFHTAWWCIFATGVLAALTALALGRVRARHGTLKDVAADNDQTHTPAVGLSAT